MAQASLLTFRVPHARFVSVGLFADRNHSVAARPATIDSVTMTYDALRRAAKMSKSSGSCVVIVYAPAGKCALASDDMRVWAPTASAAHFASINLLPPTRR